MTATVLGAGRTFEVAEVRQFFRIDDGQADGMERLIDDLLDAGRLDKGTPSFAPQPTAVASLVDQVRSTIPLGGARHLLRGLDTWVAAGDGRRAAYHPDPE